MVIEEIVQVGRTNCAISGHYQVRSSVYIALYVCHDTPCYCVHLFRELCELSEH